jgi:predicted DNA-binding ribbon-helix-helix protein
MCRIFSEVSPDLYASETRSVRLGGHATSIRLEAAFWSTLEEIATVQGMSIGRFLSKLHDEVLAFSGESQNFTSLLRCACLTYVSELRGQQSPEKAILEGRMQTIHLGGPGTGTSKFSGLQRIRQ